MWTSFVRHWVLMDAIMDAEVSTRIGAEHGERSSAYSPQRVPFPHVGYQGRHDGASHTEAQGRVKSPDVV